MKPAKVSIALLVIQLAIISTITVKYLYQRLACPRVWTRAVAFDPQLPMRGRYLSLQVMVDGCQSTLPSAKAAEFPRDNNGAAVQGPFGLRVLSHFRAQLKVQNNRLIAINPVADETGLAGQQVIAVPEKPCDQMVVDEPVAFYIPENAIDPSHLSPGQELWIEVTVPPAGPPRPVQLALKVNESWKPLAFQ
jgi:hypothetical protein